MDDACIFNEEVPDHLELQKRWGHVNRKEESPGLVMP